MLHRTEPSTVVILLASVYPPSPLPLLPRPVGSREELAKIFRSMFYSVLVCVVFTSRRPGPSQIMYWPQTPFSRGSPFNVECNCSDSKMSIFENVTLSLFLRNLVLEVHFTS
jgi:hypothetical protein